MICPLSKSHKKPGQWRKLSHDFLSSFFLPTPAFLERRPVRYFRYFVVANFF